MNHPITGNNNNNNNNNNNISYTNKNNNNNNRRVNRDYDIPPNPKIHYFSGRDKLVDVKNALLGMAYYPRIILHPVTPTNTFIRKEIQNELIEWSSHSI